MQNAWNILALDFTASAAKEALSASLVRLDVATGKKAKEVCEVVAEKLGPGWKMMTFLTRLSSVSSIPVEFKLHDLRRWAVPIHLRPKSGRHVRSTRKGRRSVRVQSRRAGERGS